MAIQTDNHIGRDLRAGRKPSRIWFFEYPAVKAKRMLATTGMELTRPITILYCGPIMSNIETAWIAKADARATEIHAVIMNAFGT